MTLRHRLSILFVFPGALSLAAQSPAGSAPPPAAPAQVPAAAQASSEQDAAELRGPLPLSPVWLRHVAPRYDAARHEATFKAYDEIRDPAGIAPITKGEGGLYPHHRGAFLGWNRTIAGDRVFDFWHGKDGASLRPGRGTRAQEPKAGGPPSLECRIDWTAGDGAIMLRETRRIAASSPAPGVVRFDYDFRLEAASGPVRLEGDAQHAGFQIRLAQEVAERKAETVYARHESARGGKDDLWQGGSWVACRASVLGRPLVVFQLADPRDRRPLVWSTRDYGRFGAFFTETVAPQAPLGFGFRILVADAAAVPVGTEAAFASRHGGI